MYREYDCHLFLQELWLLLFCVARVQIPLILEVQHIDNTLNELLIKFNSTSPKQGQFF